MTPATPFAHDRAAPDRFPRLVADIGGTNARFGWIASPAASISHVHKLPVAQHAGPAEAARHYLADLAAELGSAYRPPRRAALAVATAVGQDWIGLTNSHWRFSRAQVQAELGLDALLMLNDFEALALSLPCLSAAQLRGIGPQGQQTAAPLEPPRSGTLAVLGPGTGLGVGGVIHTRAGWVALSGEGGHVSLAPADDFESQLLAQVRRRHPHVSAERLLSGIGLPTLHQGVAAVLGVPVAELSAEQIVETGVAGTDAVCVRALEVFCALLGGVAGNLALTLGARGGVYIGGGIVPRLGDGFFRSAFRARFEAKGRFEAYLQTIPTHLITDTLAALLGSALAIEQLAD